jgi:hypothetical protein
VEEDEEEAEEEVYKIDDKSRNCVRVCEQDEGAEVAKRKCEP